MKAGDVPAKFIGYAKNLSSTVGKASLAGVDAAVAHRWGAAKERAQRVTGASLDEKVQALAKSFAEELATVGAVTGGSAAIPAVGTGASLSISAAEFGWVTFRLSELILTIAALHGHDEPTVEEQRMWILSVLAFGDGAVEGFSRLAAEVGKGLGKKATTSIPMSVLRAINSSLGRTIVTKYGKRRGVIALGTALPFGIGAGIGAGANYLTVSLLAKYAHRFFGNLPYNTVEAYSPA